MATPLAEHNEAMLATLFEATNSCAAWFFLPDSSICTFTSTGLTFMMTKQFILSCTVPFLSTSESNPRKRRRDEVETNAKAEASSGNPNVSSADQVQEGPASVVNVPLFENHMEFPDQLWELLKYPEELRDAIWWMPGNDAFAINETAFSEKLLQSHFRGNRFTSIIRKLNRWGFRKHVDRSLPPKTVAYYHRSFQKGRPELIKLIEKEEGKTEQPARGGALVSQFSLFPEATTSERIAHVLQPSTPLTLRNMFSPFAVPANPAGSGSTLASRLSTPAPAAGAPWVRLTTLTSPLNGRSDSTILQSIFGQRAAPTTNASTFTTTTSMAGADTCSSANGATASAGLAAASVASPSRQLWQRASNLVQLSQLQHRLQQHDAHTESMEQQALLRSMVSNIERERQQPRQHWQQDGRLLLALERERSRLVVQEQKQELELPLSDADASLFSLMATGQRETYLGIHQYRQQQYHQQQPRQYEPTNRLLAAAGCRQGEEIPQRSALLVARQQQQQQQLLQPLASELQLRRELHAAIASPNPFASPLTGQTGLGRRVLGQDSLSLPAELILSPQQRIQRQILQLRQRREEDQAHLRSSSNLPPPWNADGR
jgi:HSF-type DNA-binding